MLITNNILLGNLNNEYKNNKKKNIITEKGLNWNLNFIDNNQLKEIISVISEFIFTGNIYQLDTRNAVSIKSMFKNSKLKTKFIKSMNSLLKNSKFIVDIS